MNVACDYEAPMQMLTTGKIYSGRPTVTVYKLTCIRPDSKCAFTLCLRKMKKNAAPDRSHFLVKNILTGLLLTER